MSTSYISFVLCRYIRTASIEIAAIVSRLVDNVIYYVLAVFDAYTILL